jgi:hypothetical protein
MRDVGLLLCAAAVANYLATLLAALWMKANGVQVEVRVLSAPAVV